MSHELRTPLNGIMGLTYLCLQNQLPIEQENYLKKIQYSASQLLKTINSILNFSCLDSGKFQLNHIPFHLKPLVENIFVSYKEQAKLKPIEYTLTLPETIRASYEGDPFHIRQILYHLLSNAFKFTQKGCIHLHLQILESKQSNKDILLFKIQDTGLGIKKEHIQALFAGFNQGDSSFSREYQGTGLGLSLSKQLALLMEGTIQVESVENKGSTFYFTLKLLVSGTQSTKEKTKKNLKFSENTLKILNSQSTQNILSTKKILLVEDNLINQEIALELLANIGLKAFLAENGIEALDLSVKENFDLILMDIQMPLMNGLEATKKLREKGFKKPIIALSAHSSEEDIQQSIDSGMDDHITKPINPEIFKEKLITYLFAQ